MSYSRSKPPYIPGRHVGHFIPKALHSLKHHYIIPFNLATPDHLRQHHKHAPPPPRHQQTHHRTTTISAFSDHENISALLKGDTGTGVFLKGCE
ncbi:hypothetical protein E2C01_022677 [Portunus trituberculatus]|uniref:Uncharacterized protein n=1 Tax=Portunus trituberculatus TaxID=210409 RepID=A0A5B7E7X8_PORTR|nr:hypothetical protein [Portunus trituberculatus]